METFQIGIFCALFFAAYSFSRETSAFRYDIDDGKLNMTEIIRKYGFKAEIHHVLTEDGYILTQFRIPPGRKCRRKTKKIPVVLQHGLISSSYDYIISGPSVGLPFLLARTCRDVWIANSRGNEFGRKHVTLDPSDPKFWDFSWHEIGYYDNPAIIDYILNTTGHKDLHYVGFSQGTTVSYVFGALRPAYHAKVRSIHSLSPIALTKHVTPIWTKFLSLFSEDIYEFTKLIGFYELQPIVELIRSIGTAICTVEHSILLEICANAAFMAQGRDEPQFNKSALSTYLGHLPSGSSVKQVIHYGQIFKSGRFTHFDYGPRKNFEIYRSIHPPEYNLSKINIPIALYYAKKDLMAPPEDVMEIKARLPIVAEAYEIPYWNFNHIDFILAIDAKTLVYDKIIEVMKRFD